jgi:putative ABC transport system substrate-binding protein
MIKRRKFITLLGGAAAAWPLAARAQQRTVNPVIGFLTAGDNAQNLLAPLHRGLRELGYVEGQNVAIEYRWGATSADRRREYATDLVRQQVAVILASNDGPALAAKRATSTIPIVFTNIFSDPVKLGLVASINRPGGNVTGVGFGAEQLVAKRLDLLSQMVPTVVTLGHLTGGPGYLSFEEERNQLVAAASALGRQLITVECRNSKEIGRAFATFVERGAGAVTLSPIPLFFGSNVDRIVAFAAQYKIPAMYPGRVFAMRGGLMSYTPNGADQLRIAAGLVGQILKGATPADLPVRISTKFDFVINVNTAKGLGLDVPQHLLVFADEVIE